MNLVDLFDLSLNRPDDRVALEFGGEEHTFRTLENRSNRLANMLSQDGFESGDRIAVYLKNCVELIDVFLAAVKLGLIFVPMNILYREREIEHILTDSQPKGVVTSQDLEEHLKTAWRKLDAPYLYRKEDLGGLTRECSRERPHCPADGDSPAAIVYTSGTTGRSKGAVLTHNNFVANAVNLITSWQLCSSDRLLLSLPLFHVHGLGNGVHTWLAAGYRMRLLERFDKETIAREFLDFRPTVFFGVPTMYERLLAVPPETAREIGEFVRLFVSGSAPLSSSTFERFHELYGHFILERYGMSETMMNTSNPYAGERRPGTVGKPLPGISVRLVDPASGQVVPAGEVGEILIKGPNVFAGYWRQQQATAEAFTPDGFFRSGDLGSCSSDGYYTLTGRRTELIICSGFNIYPREIEEFLQEQPEVAEAAAVGASDPVRGEVVVAYVVAAPGRTVDEEKLCARCRESLASFKAPRRIIAVDKLPRNALGKLQRHLLPR